MPSQITRCTYLAYVILSISIAFILSQPLTALYQTACTVFLPAPATPLSAISMSTAWFQHSITLSSKARGCHLVTSEILKPLSKDLSKIQIGSAHFFIQHTSAALTINENADSDVQRDMHDFFMKLVPDHTQFRHDAEGSDDMTAHVKSSIFGAGITIPITNGRLNLGTWQGIWLVEGRTHGGSRRIVATLNGQVSGQ